MDDVRRQLLRALGLGAVAVPIASTFEPFAFAQGRCIRAYGSPGCSTDPIPEIFEKTGWNTIGLDHIRDFTLDNTGLGVDMNLMGNCIDLTTCLHST